MILNNKCKLRLIDGSDIVATDYRVGSKIGFGHWKFLNIVDHDLINGLVRTRIERRKGILFFFKIRKDKAVYLELDWI